MIEECNVLAFEIKKNAKRISPEDMENYLDRVRRSNRNLENFCGKILHIFSCNEGKNEEIVKVLLSNISEENIPRAVKFLHRNVSAWTIKLYPELTAKILREQGDGFDWPILEIIKNFEDKELVLKIMQLLVEEDELEWVARISENLTKDTKKDFVKEHPLITNHILKFSKDLRPFELALLSTEVATQVVQNCEVSEDTKKRIEIMYAPM